MYCSDSQAGTQASQGAACMVSAWSLSFPAQHRSAHVHMILSVDGLGGVPLMTPASPRAAVTHHGRHHRESAAACILHCCSRAAFCSPRRCNSSSMRTILDRTHDNTLSTLCTATLRSAASPRCTPLCMVPSGTCSRSLASHGLQRALDLVLAHACPGPFSWRAWVAPLSAMCTSTGHHS